MHTGVRYLPLGVAVYFASVAFVLLFSGDAPFSILIGFLPLLAGVVVGSVLISNGLLMGYWLVPVVFPGLFLIGWRAGIPVIAQMDGPVIALVNGLLLIIAGIIGLMVTYVGRDSPKKSPDLTSDQLYQSSVKTQAQPRQGSSSPATPLAAQDAVTPDQSALSDVIRKYEQTLRELEHKLDQQKKYTHAMSHKHHHEQQQYRHQVQHLQDQLKELSGALAISRQSLTTTLRSIEDKCKALNFAVGRVYSDKKGGSPQLRELLLIKREYYNRFSEITADYSDEDAKTLLGVLHQLKEQLAVFAKKEADVFVVKPSEIVVQRKPDGQSIILDVLADNDTDPVREYFTEAADICTRLIEYLQR